MRITEGGLQDPDVIALLREHLQGMADHSPPESIHALDVEGLKAPGITFWTVRDGDEVLGCIALKRLDARHGEIKSMRTVARHLRRGVAEAILERIVEVARERGYTRLSLETGADGPFEAALRFYEKHGFEYCEPFADYKPDPLSRFMTRLLR